MSDAVKFGRYCSCGAAATGQGTPAEIGEFDEFWQERHGGPGHQPVSPKVAAAARRRQALGVRA